MRSVIKILFYIILGLFVAMLLLPFVFRDKFDEELRTFINQKLNAEVKYEKARLNFFTAFPDASLSIADLRVAPTNTSIKEEILAVEKLNLTIDLYSLFKNEIVAKELTLNNANINLVIDKGNSNLDFLINEKSNTENRDITFDIQSIKLSDADILVTNRDLSSSLKLSGLNQVGRANFKAENYILSSIADANTISLINDNITIFEKLPFKSKMQLDIDTKSATYTVKEGAFSLDKAEFDLQGDVSKVKDAYNLDLFFNTGELDFGHIYSLIPGINRITDRDLEFGGIGSLDGRINGFYHSSNSYPNIFVNLACKNGSITILELEKEINNLELELSLKSTTTDLSNLGIEVHRFNFDLEEESFAGNLLIDSILGDYDLDLFLKSTMNLSNLKLFFDVPQMSETEGVATVDIDLSCSKNEILKKSFTTGKANYSIQIKEGTSTYLDYPKITSSDIILIGDESKAELLMKNTKFGNSTFEIKSLFSNPLQVIIGNKISGDLQINGSKFDYNELIANSGESAYQYGLDSTLIEKYFDSFNYILQLDTLEYYGYELLNIHSTGTISPSEISSNQTSLFLDNSEVIVQGNLQNVYDYIVRDSTLTGKLSVSGKYLDCASILSGNDELNTGAETLSIPSKVNIEIQTDFEEMVLNKYNFENLSGVININNSKLSLNEFNMNALAGKLNLKGDYTAIKDSTGFVEFYVDLKNAQFKELFSTSPSFSKLLPIAEYIEGTLNSEFRLIAPLDKDYKPILSETNSFGLLETIDGRIEGLKVLDKIGDKLGIETLKSFVLKNSKNWFEIDNGAFIITPRSTTVEDMEFSIEGRHYLDRRLDYNVNAIIPRSRLKDNTISAYAESGLSLIEKKAKELGIDISSGDYIYLEIDITGTFDIPQLKISPTGSGGESSKEIIEEIFEDKTQEIEDTIKSVIDDKVKQVKDTLSTIKEQAIDTISEEIEKQIESGIDIIKEELKDKISDQKDSLLDSVLIDTLTQKANEILGENAKEEIEEIKEKINSWNPFKKK